jgi:hypothetical protein
LGGDAVGAELIELGDEEWLFESSEFHQVEIEIEPGGN